MTTTIDRPETIKRARFSSGESVTRFLQRHPDGYSHPSQQDPDWQRGYLKNGTEISYKHGALGPRCKAFLVGALTSAGMLALVALLVNWGW